MPLEGEQGHGLLALESPRLIAEALRSGFRLEQVLLSNTGEDHHGPRLLPQLSKHTAVTVVPDAVFQSAVNVEQPQGAAALVRVPLYGLEQVFSGKENAAEQVGGAPLLVVAAGLQDPGNMGTLVRAADAFGATAMVALTDTVSPWNAKAVRASAGSVLHIPIVTKVEPSALIALCRSRDLPIYTTAAKGKAPLPQLPLRGGLCLVIGQEGAGVPRELQRAATANVAVPMLRDVESLNAGVAGAIILYEVARQRGFERHDVSV